MNYKTLFYSIKDCLLILMIRFCTVCIVVATLVSEARAYRCVSCLEGKYKSVIANDACLSCPRDTYLNYIGAIDWSECKFCPNNTMTRTSWGGVFVEDCVCKPGFYGGNGGPCLPCEAGKYNDEMGQTQCKTCPGNSFSSVQSDALTDCECVAGYTGPNGGVCTECALNTYKPSSGPQACTSCVQNTMTIGTGKITKDACICTPGYTDGGGVAALSTSVCLRFLALWPTRSFDVMSAKLNAGVGSATLPTFVATGGPSGNGYVHFENDQFLWKRQGILNPRTNGGITVVTVVRLSSQSNSKEYFFNLNLNGVYFSIFAENQMITVHMADDFGDLSSIQSPPLDLTQWLRITVTYNTVLLTMTVSFNDAAPITAPIFGGMMNDGRLVNGQLSSIILGGSSEILSRQGFSGDMSGFFFVDEVLSSNAITSIRNQMTQNMDVSSVCSAGDSVCVGCSAGKFKVNPGPSPCTDCSVNTYSTAVAATSSATCEGCPDFAVSDVGSGVITACKCNTGYTGADGNTCSACELGQYKESTGTALCTNCGLGKYSGLPAAKTALTCTTCPENSWTKLTGNDVIEDCECNAGYTGPNGGHCTACPAGKYKLIPGSSECISCASNTYSTEVASTSGASCLWCPEYSQSPEGSSARAACICNAGYTGKGGMQILNVGVAPCTACIAGTYKPTTGSATCTNCVANTYSTEVAATSNVCVGCAANMQSGVASDESTDCKCNKGYTGGDGTTCTACVAGTYKTTVGSQTCTNCAANTYSTALARETSNCETCATNSQSPPGSDELIDCKCNAGYSGEDGGACTACGSGRYKAVVGSAPCSECQENNYQPLYAQTSVTACKYCGANSLSPVANALQASCQCAPGYTGENGGICTACFMGKFKPAKGSQPCTLCPSETYSGATAQTSITTCKQCPQFSLAVMGSSARTDCHCIQGYYTDDFGLETSRCTMCAPGTYNDKLNAEACSKCAAGKFSDKDAATNEETCTTCPSGYSHEGQAQCESCPGNSTALPGSDMLTDCQCNPGYTGNNGETCMYCVPGKFKVDFGPAACTNCPPDTYSPDIAREFENDCDNCLANSQAPAGSDSRDDCKCKVGWTSNLPGLDGEQCVACSPGKFKDKIGHYACELCEKDTYLPFSSSTSKAACQNCFLNSKSDPGSDSEEDCLCVGGFEREPS